MPDDPPLNLSGLDLSGASFVGQVNYEGSRTDVKAVSLQGANLRGTDLPGAMFAVVYLWGADFRGVA
jgi:uncharacterized protein YjbI with pentapeptide repeats